MASEHSEAQSNEKKEISNIQIEEIIFQSDDLLDVLRQCIDLGGSETTFSFSLARANDGVDIIFPKQRFLFYPTNSTDQISQTQLKKGQIPQLDLLAINPENGLAVVKVPPQAVALDSLQFPEQGFTTSHLGAYQIMAKIGEYLARIYKVTGLLPTSLRLVDLSLSPREVDFIRLVPPLSLNSDTSISQVISSLFMDLNLQDPRHNHQGQVSVIEERFKLDLEQP